MSLTHVLHGLSYKVWASYNQNLGLSFLFCASAIIHETGCCYAAKTSKIRLFSKIWMVKTRIELTEYTCTLVFYHNNLKKKLMIQMQNMEI